MRERKKERPAIKAVLSPAHIHVCVRLYSMRVCWHGRTKLGKTEKIRLLARYFHDPYRTDTLVQQIINNGHRLTVRSVRPQQVRSRKEGGKTSEFTYT